MLVLQSKVCNENKLRLALKQLIEVIQQ